MTDAVPQTAHDSFVFWAGKHLASDEEAFLRRRVSSLQRAEAAGDDGARKERLSLERYLPENLAAWTPDQLEGGAHVGPWVDIEATR